VLPKLSLADLKPGELEIVDASWRTKRYECGHRGSRSFVLLIGAYNLRSPIIQQEKFCPQCVRQQVCDALVRCPICGQVYEVMSPGSVSGGIAISSLRHLEQCLPKCVKQL
jgi:hypothetical protein